MTTWIIISACLYLEGAYWCLHMFKNDNPPNPLIWNIVGALAWPFLILLVMCEGLWDFIKYALKRFRMKYLSAMLLIFLCSCNDGGSDPEFVKSKRTDPTPDQQLHLDSTIPWVASDVKMNGGVATTHWFGHDAFVFNKDTDMDFDWGNPCLAKDAQTQDTVILYYDSVGRKYSSVPIRGLTPLKFEMLKIILKKEK